MPLYIVLKYKRHRKTPPYSRHIDGLVSVAAGTAGAIEGCLVVQILVWVHLFAIMYDFDVYMRAG